MELDLKLFRKTMFICIYCMDLQRRRVACDKKKERDEVKGDECRQRMYKYFLFLEICFSVS